MIGLHLLFDMLVSFRLNHVQAIKVNRKMFIYIRSFELTGFFKKKNHLQLIANIHKGTVGVKTPQSTK
jgi:hypothetical protein